MPEEIKEIPLDNPDITEEIEKQEDISGETEAPAAEAEEPVEA